MVNGHDGNIAPMEEAARYIKHETGVTVGALLDCWYTSARLLPKDTFRDPGGLGHGGEGETSLNLAINRDLVKLDNIRTTRVYEAIELREWPGPSIRMFYNLGDYSPVGFCGNALFGTAEKGEAMLEACVDLISKYFVEVDHGGLI
jgi:creatinine amidohydrolase